LPAEETKSRTKEMPTTRTSNRFLPAGPSGRAPVAGAAAGGGRRREPRARANSDGGRQGGGSRTPRALLQARWSRVRSPRQIGPGAARRLRAAGGDRHPAGARPYHRPSGRATAVDGDRPANHSGPPAVTTEAASLRQGPTGGRSRTSEQIGPFGRAGRGGFNGRAGGPAGPTDHLLRRNGRTALAQKLKSNSAAAVVVAAAAAAAAATAAAAASPPPPSPPPSASESLPSLCTEHRRVAGAWRTWV
jgi:hypothetical protein